MAGPKQQPLPPDVAGYEKIAWRLTRYIFWRWVLATLAFVAVAVFGLPILEFPLMLLVAIISRVFGYPDFAGTMQQYISLYLHQPIFIGPLILIIGFVVLKSMILKAIQAEIDGKAFTVQDFLSASQSSSG